MRKPRQAKTGRASEYRKRAEERRVADVALPSGAVFTLRRPNLREWVQNGRIPQWFLAKSLEAANGGSVAPDDFSNDEAMQAIELIRNLIIDACVSPRLVVGGTGDDELDPAELEPDDFTFLSQWVMSGSPSVPVETKGGEVTIDGLSRFRQKQPGGKPISLEPDGEQVRETA